MGCGRQSAWETGHELATPHKTEGPGQDRPAPSTNLSVSDPVATVSGVYDEEGSPRGRDVAGRCDGGRLRRQQPDGRRHRQEGLSLTESELMGPALVAPRRVPAPRRFHKPQGTQTQARGDVVRRK